MRLTEEEISKALETAPTLQGLAIAQLMNDIESINSNTYINPTVRRNLFKEMKRMEDRAGVDSKQDAWRGVVAVLNQHNNLMDVNNSYAKEGAKISEYYREHGGDKIEIREYESIAAMKDDYDNGEQDKMVFTDTPDPLENFIDRHFKVITAVILFTFVGLSWFIGA